MKGVRRHDARIIIYYVGHGAYLGDHEYYLALRCTDDQAERTSGLESKVLAEIVNKKHTRNYLILDCCFAGEAVKDFQVGDITPKVRDDTSRMLRATGTALFCACSKHDVAISRGSGDLTQFSECLTDTLECGASEKGETLTLRDVNEKVCECVDRFKPGGINPELHSPTKGGADIANYPLFPNQARKSDRDCGDKRVDGLTGENEDKSGDTRGLKRILAIVVGMSLLLAITSVGFYLVRGFGGANSSPSFDGVSVEDQSYVTGEAIDALTFPEAMGGNGVLRYSLAPPVPGLTFSDSNVTLTGTPTAPGNHDMSYTAMDADDDVATLRFVITVSARDAAQSSDGVTGGNVALEVRTGSVFKDCVECPDMVVVPAGGYEMGSPESENSRQSTEGPQHWVDIVERFAVGVYEVTFAEWDACVRADGCRRPDDEGWGREQRPVINVSSEDAEDYVAWLSRRTGEQYRLPTESEWEYVARARTKGPFTTGDTISSDRANYSGQAYRKGEEMGEYRAQTVEVGGFEANDFGLYDVHGNVWEWVQDCWNDSYAGAPSDGSAWKEGDCSDRIVRGGSWGDLPSLLRSANRVRVDAGVRTSYIGFRVVRTLTAPS